MDKKLVMLCVAAVVASFVVSGCETVPKKYKEEMTGMKTRVDTLESRVEGVETKQAEVERTAGEAAQAVEELKSQKEATKSNISVRLRPGKSSDRIAEIQTALRNAGYYSGTIDGIKGKQTRKAIMDFQKANGLKADGIVGSKTWSLLSGHAESASGSQEGAK